MEKIDRRSVVRAAALSAAGVALAAPRAGPLRVGFSCDAADRYGPHLDEYLHALASCRGVDEIAVAAHAGLVETRARAVLGSRFPKLAVYPDTSSMMAEFPPALVIVSMEADRAPAAIETALAGGADVVAEKPACVRVEDFERLVRFATDRKRSLALAFATRLNPLAIRARDLIRGGSLGKLYAVQMMFVADQARLVEPGYQRSWRAFRSRAGGGYLAWLGIHYIDLAQFLSGARVARVGALIANAGGQPIEVEDSAALSLAFDTGITGTLQSGYYLDRGYQTGIRLWGSQGWMHLDLKGERRLVWTSGGTTKTVVAGDDPAAANEYPAMVQAAVDSTRGTERWFITAQESLRTLRVVFAAYRSAATGAFVVP